MLTGWMALECAPPRREMKSASALESALESEPDNARLDMGMKFMWAEKELHFLGNRLCS
jgi:hypothetical protein